MNPLIQPLLQIAREAGDAIMTIYQQDDHGIQEKADNSPLTLADLAAHRIIEQGLNNLTPDIPQLSEESAEIPFSERSQWQRYWLIDPLDGTKEFIRRNDEFTVNIALIEDHQPVMGVICLPVSGICYFGSRDGGAWKQKRDKAPAMIQTRPHNSPLKVLASRRHKTDKETPVLERLTEQFGPLQKDNYGSSLKMCVIAEGLADIYPRLYPTCEWDTAAAQAVVEAAGGQILDSQLQPLRYNTRESLINPDFFVIGDKAFPTTLLSNESQS